MIDITYLIDELKSYINITKNPEVSQVITRLDNMKSLLLMDTTEITSKELTQDMIDKLKHSLSNPFNTSTNKYDPCDQCPNNTKNGGSGNCNCVLPFMSGKFTITCKS